MPTLVQQQPESHHRAGARPMPAFLAAPAAFFAAQCVFGFALAAQTPTTPATTPASPPAHHHKKPAAAKSAAQPAAAPVPAAPQIPNWPANNKPAEATVTWDSHGLFIQASNSSLDQILKDISLKTGATIEGMGADERIFGAYGPGSARDVLAELLDGSGYNILLIGDLGQGTPRKIVLSGRPTVPAPGPGKASPSTTNDNDAENDQENGQPEPNPPVQPPLQSVVNNAPGVPMRTPQQMLEERQLQIQQMQQQQPNSPQN